MAVSVLLMVITLTATLTPWVLSAPDSQGTEFILGFLENVPYKESSPNDIELFITTSSNTAATVTVTTPLFDPSWNQTLTVSRGNIQVVKVPHEIRGVKIEKSNKGVWIQSTEEVSVYCVNKELKSTDAFISLPVDVLGQEYYALTYTNDAELLVVATQDNTEVSVTWPDSEEPCSVSFERTTYTNGDTLTLTLDKFETFHAMQQNRLSDFTGAHITSDKPIAVVSGNKKVSVPVDSGSADHLTEMLMPVDTWGKNFISTSTPDRGIGDIFRIVASENDTSIFFSGGGTENIIKAGDFKEVDIPTGDYQTITSNKPVMIAMFAKSFQKDGPYHGDPAMSLIIPEPQYASDYTWSSVKDPTEEEFNNKVAVIIEKSEMSGLRLDGGDVTWEEQEDVEGSTKVHLWARVTPGCHNLFHTDPSVTFMALVSGTFRVNSYAYAAGLRLAQINTECVPSEVVVGDIVDNDCDGRVDEEALNNADDDGDGLIDEDLAPPPRVDGNWGPWDSYGPCTMSSEGSEVKTRTRSCDNPAPANNGLDCPGSGTETASCSTGPPGPCCSGSVQADIVFILDASGSSDFEAMKQLVRDLVDEFQDSSTTTRVGVQTYSSGTNTEFNLNQHYDNNSTHIMNVVFIGGSDSHMSAVHGNWGVWGPYGACSVPCGGPGVKTRTRACDNPAPANNGLDCPGSDTETASCDNGDCPVNGNWGVWGPYGACSVSCGGSGEKTRTRACDSPAPANNGLDCPGSDTETASCDNGDCPEPTTKPMPKEPTTKPMPKEPTTKPMPKEPTTKPMTKE